MQSFKKPKRIKGVWSSTNKPILQPYITIWQSELEFICGLAFSNGCIETGGELYGLQSHAGRHVIMFATPPGPEAIHGVAYFRQDIDFFRKLNQDLGDKYGLQYIGSWHHHHHLNIKGLSTIDIRSTNSVASKNGYHRLCQIVLTFETTPIDASPFSGNQSYYDKFTPERMAKEHSKLSVDQEGNGLELKNRSGLYRHSRTLVRINSFFYLDAKSGQPIRCPIRMIAGISPITRVLRRECAIPDLLNPYRFPISRILFDSFKFPHDTERDSCELPIALYNQFKKLPQSVQKRGRASFKEGIVLISLRIPGENGIVFVAYQDQEPYRVVAVYCTQSRETQTLIDATKVALSFGRFAELRTIYDRTVSFSKKKSSTASKEL